MENTKFLIFSYLVVLRKYRGKTFLKISRFNYVSIKGESWSNLDFHNMWPISYSKKIHSLFGYIFEVQNDGVE